MALLTLSTPFTAIAPLSITDSDPIDLVATTVGFGLHGFGNGSVTDFDGVKRASQNVIDVYAEDAVERWTYQTDFDRSNGTTSSFGSALPLDLEGSTAPADSGAPLIANFRGTEAIVGILSSGYNPITGGASQYGDISLYGAISDPANVSFLEANGVVLVAIPEPGTSVLLLVGMAMWARRSRGSR